MWEGCIGVVTVVTFHLQDHSSAISWSAFSKLDKKNLRQNDLDWDLFWCDKELLASLLTIETHQCDSACFF